MESAIQLAQRIRETFLTKSTINFTSFKSELENTPLENAQNKIGNHNTIEVITRHVHYYINGVKNVLDGGALTITDAKSFDFTPYTTQKEWENFLNSFWTEVNTLTELVERLGNNHLEATFVKPEYGTYHRNIAMLIEHGLYHLGQLVLLKKLIMIK